MFTLVIRCDVSVNYLNSYKTINMRQRGAVEESDGEPSEEIIITRNTRNLYLLFYFFSILLLYFLFLHSAFKKPFSMSAIQ